jgi:hypothetical protein
MSIVMRGPCVAAGANVSNREDCRPALQRLPSFANGGYLEVNLRLFDCR